METVLIVIRIFFPFLKQQQVLSWGADEATDTEPRIFHVHCVSNNSKLSATLLIRDPPILGTTQHICDEDVRRLRGRSEGSADSKLIVFSVFLSLPCVENGS